MVEHGTHKTYEVKLKPGAKQERALESTITLCRKIYNAALGGRKDGGLMRGVRVNCFHQRAELPGIKDAMPEYGEVNAQLLQDVLLRVDRAFQAYFRRVRNGETPGYPRFYGRDRYTSFTYPQAGDHGGERSLRNPNWEVSTRWSGMHSPDRRRTIQHATTRHR